MIPAALASIILSSPFEEKAAEEDAEPLFGSCTRLVVGSNQAEKERKRMGGSVGEDEGSASKRKRPR